METYSTEEQVVGTWIDGKPIYRKCVIANATISGGQFLTQITLPNFDSLVRIFGRCKENSNWYQIPTTFDSSWRYIAYLNINGSIYNLSTIFSSQTTNTYIFIEYTKTTD